MGNGAGTIEQERQDEWSSDGLFFFWLFMVLAGICLIFYNAIVDFSTAIWSWLTEFIAELIADIRYKLEIEIPKVLKEQLARAALKADERGRTLKTNRHHIVARIDPRAKDSRDILERAIIDINSEENIATINREAHWYLHTTLYHWGVAEYLGKAEKAGEGRVSAALATLKWELMNL